MLDMLTNQEKLALRAILRKVFRAYREELILSQIVDTRDPRYRILKLLRLTFKILANEEID